MTRLRTLQIACSAAPLVDRFQKKQSEDQNRKRNPKLRVSQYTHHPPAVPVVVVDGLHIVLPAQTERLREMGRISQTVRVARAVSPASGQASKSDQELTVTFK